MSHCDRAAIWHVVYDMEGQQVWADGRPTAHMGQRGTGRRGRHDGRAEGGARAEMFVPGLLRVF